MSLGCLLLVFRKTGIVVATLVTAPVFGLTHLATYGSLLQVLLVQGLESIIGMFAYLKTKNMLVSYVAHVVYDFLTLGLAGLSLALGDGVPLMSRIVLRYLDLANW